MVKSFLKGFLLTVGVETREGEVAIIGELLGRFIMPNNSCVDCLARTLERLGLRVDESERDGFVASLTLGGGASGP